MSDLAEQAQAPPGASEEVRRLRQMFLLSPSFSALLQGPDHRFVMTSPTRVRA
jgi:hypothetical protein